MKKEIIIGIIIGAILMAIIALMMNGAFAVNNSYNGTDETNIVNIIRVILDDGENTEIIDVDENTPEIEYRVKKVEETTEEEIGYLSYPTSETENEASVVDVWNPREEDIIAMAKLLYGECRGVKSKAEQAAVAWCVLNRFDNPRFGGETIYDVITAKNQFMGYKETNPVTDELYELAKDVMYRWHREQMGCSPVGRTLPKEYVYFVGKNGHNWFSAKWKSGEYFDFDKLATNPYRN